MIRKSIDINKHMEMGPKHKSGIFKHLGFCLVELVPDQPPYNITWHIVFSRPKKNIFFYFLLQIICFKNYYKNNVLCLLWLDEQA